MHGRPKNEEALGERFLQEGGAGRPPAVSSLAAACQPGAEQAQAHQRERGGLGNLRAAAAGRAHDAAREFEGFATAADVLELRAVGARPSVRKFPLVPSVRVKDSINPSPTPWLPPPEQLFPSQRHRSTDWKDGKLTFREAPQPPLAAADINVGLTMSIPNDVSRLFPGPEELFEICTPKIACVAVSEVSVNCTVADSVAPW